MILLRKKEINHIYQDLKKLNYPGLHIKKEKKNLYNEKFPTPKKDLKKTLKLERPPLSLVGENNIVKMATFPMETYTFNALP
jgi:hypothetical protein